MSPTDKAMREARERISESIFSCEIGNEKIIVPLADVTHVTTQSWGNPKRNSYEVHVKDNVVKMKHNMGKEFMKAWCFYRHEFDEVNL